jgi:cyclophilin family peptidyl-prolyl cis-trans isomerase
VWAALKSGDGAGRRRFFAAEPRAHLRHDRRGLVGMAATAGGLNGSQFYVTLGAGPFQSLDGRQTIFGEVAEGLGVLERLNEAPVDGAAAAASAAGGRGTGAGDGDGGDGGGGEWRPCRNVR